MAKRSTMRVVLCTCIALIYAVQIFSPLRVNADVVSLLQLTGQLSDGQPYLTHGVKPVYPIGVPYCCSILERAGVATPLGFGLFNLCCILIAAVSAWSICDRITAGQSAMGTSIVIVAFSNFVLLKHSVLPLTDIPYMACSLGCLAILEATEQQQGPRRLIGIGLALLLLTASILARRIGIALIPAMLFAGRPLAMTSIERWKQLSLKVRWLAAAIVLIVLCAIAPVTARHLIYLPDFRNAYGQSGLLSMAKELARMRIVEFGELSLNLPASQLGRLRAAVLFAGVPAIALLIIGIYHDRKTLRPVHVYLLAYLGIMFVWPFGDPRFWLPVLPLLAWFVWQGFRSSLSRVWALRLGTAYLTVYAAAAVLAAVYTTRLTFAGTRFPELYAGGSLKADYLQAATAQPALDTSASAVIRRYGRRHVRSHR